MAKVTTKTLAGGASAELIQEFMDEIPVDVIDGMLTAEADIIEPAIVSNAETMLKGPYSTGDTAKAVFRKAPHNYKAARGGGQRQVPLQFRNPVQVPAVFNNPHRVLPLRF